MIVEVYSQNKFYKTRKRLVIPDGSTFADLARIISKHYLNDGDSTHLYHFLLSKTGKFKFKPHNHWDADLVIAHEGAVNVLEENKGCKKTILNAMKFKISNEVFKQDDEIGFVYDYGTTSFLIVRCFYDGN